MFASWYIANSTFVKLAVYATTEMPTDITAFLYRNNVQTFAALLAHVYVHGLLAVSYYLSFVTLC